MAIRCPKCKRTYDAKLLPPGQIMHCECGAALTMKHEEVFGHLEAICRQYDVKLENEKLEEMKKLSERIAFLIVSSDFPRVDIELEKQKLRSLISKYFPDKTHLYDLIYESRFQRLWEQFRKGT